MLEKGASIQSRSSVESLKREAQDLDAQIRQLQVRKLKIMLNLG